MTLLSGIASLVSVLETLVSVFGKWLALLLPIAAAFIVACPAQQRLRLAMGICVLLCSSMVI